MHFNCISTQQKLDEQDDRMTVRQVAVPQAQAGLNSELEGCDCKPNGTVSSIVKRCLVLWK